MENNSKISTNAPATPPLEPVPNSFREGRGAFRLTVITKKMLADLQTPVGIYLKIRDLYTNSVLLESSDYHGGENSFSYIGFKPIGGISVNNFLITEQYPDGSHIKTA